MRCEGRRELTGKRRENDKQIFIHPAEEIRGKKARQRFGPGYNARFV